jgi:hypothetical protein
MLNSAKYGSASERNVYKKTNYKNNETRTNSNIIAGTPRRLVNLTRKQHKQGGNLRKISGSTYSTYQHSPFTFDICSTT